MIWYICFFIVILLLFRVCYILIQKNDKFKIAKAFICILLSSYVAYLPVFTKQFSVSGTVFGNIINTMQMVTLDANFLDYYDTINNSIGIWIFSNIYILLLGLLHVLVPIFAIITAYDCIVNFFSYLRVEIINWRSKDVFIFSDMNECSMTLAYDISENLQKKAEFIFSNTLDDQITRKKLFSKLNFYTVTSEKIDCLNIRVKKTKKIYYINISEDNNENINNTLKLSEKLKKLPKEKQRLIKIVTYSSNSETETIVDSMNKGLLDISVIDTTRLCVYDLLDRYPLYEAIDNNCISVLICGLNKVGEEVLKATLWLGQLARIRLKINVVDPDVENKRDQMELEYPEMFSDNYSICFHQANLKDKSFLSSLQKCLDTTYAVVCGEDDEDNISVSLYIRRFFLKKDLTVKKMPLIACYIDNYEKTDVVRNLRTPESNDEKRLNYDIIPFGGEKSLYTYNSVLNNNIEKLSINVHLAYEEIFNESENLNYIEALERYNTFEVNKRSNRANALHIRYKLWMLNLDYTDKDDVTEVDFSKYLCDEKLNELTIAEHDRWMAFLRTEGWVTANIQDVENYKKTDLSKGRHNCPLLKMHPYLCDFEELEKISNALDLPDATRYDRELIEKIPSILNNSAINNCNYKIIQRGIKNG